MTKDTNKNSELATLTAELTTRDDAGRITIDTQSLGRGAEKTHTIQNMLSEKGLYVSPRHRFYDDGIPGELTTFGIKVQAIPSGANEYLSGVLNDSSLSVQDILKMQIALNAETDDPSKKIDVDGIMGTQTANRYANHLASQKQTLEPAQYAALIESKNGSILTSMRKYVSAETLQSLDIRATTTNDFRQAHDHNHDNHGHSNHDHHHGQLPTNLPKTSAPMNEGKLVLSSPTKGAKMKEGMQMRSPSRSHQGIDMAPRGDDNIYAPADGVVAYAGESGGYGNLIALYHGNDVYTYYGHVPHSSVRALNVGDKIQQGQHFADMGNEGTSSGKHLHFEVVIEKNTAMGKNRDGYVVDPHRVLTEG